METMSSGSGAYNPAVRFLRHSPERWFFPILTYPNSQQHRKGGDQCQSLVQRILTIH